MVSSAGHDRVLVIWDADLLVRPQQLEDAIRLAAAAPGMVLPFDRYAYLRRGMSEWLCRNPRSGLPIRARSEWTMQGSVGGLQVMSLDTFHQAGGFDPRFRGWGFEDVAFGEAASTLVAEHRRVPGDLLHLWHPVDPTNVPDSPGYEGNRLLWGRYVEAAATGPDAMAELIAGRP